MPFKPLGIQKKDLALHYCKNKRENKMKYPIGIQSFEKLREEGYVYVDKTDLIYSLTHEGCVYFLGRPRRFGKSLLISTLKSYYLGRKKLFKGLAMERLEKDWKTYPVFHLDFGTGTYGNANALDQVLESYISEWEEKYNIVRPAITDYSLRFKKIIEEAHRQTDLRGVVLIDEYDKPLLDVMDMKNTINCEGADISYEEYSRRLLRAFYSTFKVADEHLQFVLLTGVTKFSQVSVFSDFNQPNDISMDIKYDTLCGITDDEISNYFSSAVSEMGDVYGCAPDKIRELLRKRFDGYHFSRRMKGVYNPFSLLNTFEKQDMQDYWFRTGTPSYLIRLLNHFHENLDEITGKYYMPSQFIDYRADVEKPLPMIFQSGYLTIKEYDMEMNTFLLDYPNDEVKRGFVTLLTNNYLKPKENIESWMSNAVLRLKQGDLESFHIQLASFLASIPYTMRRKENEREKERYFHYTFYLILRLLSTYTVYTENSQSQGRVDCVIETAKHIYIFEFKLDGSADEALMQIAEKGYEHEYASDERTVYKIGCSFSSETGTIADWKVIQ